MSALRTNRLHEQLAAHLCREIVAGRLPTETPIPAEPELAAERGVSKTVVRETVQALAAVGVVRIQHGKRTVVLPETDWNILSPLVQQAYRAEGRAGPLIQELYEIRLVLEPEAARWTAERARKDDLGRIERILRGMAESIDAARSGDGAGTFLEYDREFHLAIASASGNRVLRAIVRDIHELLTTSWLLTQLSPADLETVYRQHSLIADAMLESDPDAAERTMREHLEWAATTDRAGTGASAAPAPSRAREGRRR
jgi:DNA-binding FadR family transcriptional regulator